MDLARHRGALLFAGALCLYTATIDHVIPSPDETRRFALAQAVAARGPAALAGSGAVSRYPPLTSVVAAPLVRMGMALDTGGDVWARRGAVFSNVLITALLVLVFFRLLEALRYRAAAATAATIIFAIANPLWPYSKRLYGEPASALLVLSAAYGLARVRDAPRLGLAWLCGSVTLLGLSSPHMALMAGGAALVALLAARHFRLALIALGGLAVGAGLAAAVQWVRFGSLSTGYEGERFTHELATALHGLLFGPGRSIFLYAPTTLAGAAGLALAWRRGHRETVIFASLCFAGLLAFVANWWAWYGGQCFGPRLLLPVLPLLSLFMVEVIERARWRPVVRALGVFGLYVQLMGVSVTHEYDMYLWLNPDGSNERLGWFSLRHAPLLRLPRDLMMSPWDVSSDFLVREQRDRTSVLGDGSPLRFVDVEQGGQSILYAWSVADVVIASGQARRAFEVGAQFHPTGSVIGTAGGQLAVDQDPASRWWSGRYRRPGMSARIDLGVPIAVDRLDLVHSPYRDDFPSQVTARGSVDGRDWWPLRVAPGTPRLRMRLLFYLLVAVGIGALVLARASSRLTAEQPA